MLNRLLLVAITALAAAPLACGGDDDSDADTDTDADAGGDSGADSDTDTDTDSDAGSDADGGSEGCESLEVGCCNEECPCGGFDEVCIYPQGLGFDGVCKVPPGSGCWSSADCESFLTCQGASVCGCGSDCQEPDAEGSCVLTSEGCCDASSAGDCDANYDCLDLYADTCLATPSFPECWIDDDCGGGTCTGETICDCSVLCDSAAGLCAF